VQEVLCGTSDAYRTYALSSRQLSNAHVLCTRNYAHTQVLGEALLGSGYIAYLGPVPGSYRLQVSQEGLYRTVLLL
jgi:hypothetical protein